jgi:hypothetical protein
VTVQATQPGNENYLPADNIAQTILVYGVDEKKDGIKLKLYPNPTHGVLKIKLDNKENKEYTFTIFDDKGKIIQSTVLQRNDKRYEISFDLSSSPTGWYYLQVSDGTQVIVKAIRKE